MAEHASGARRKQTRPVGRKKRGRKKIERSKRKTSKGNILEKKREEKKQGRIHGYPSRVQVGRGHN